MKIVYIIIFIVGFLAFIWLIKKIFGKEKEDVAIMFSGSMGTGKTYNIVRRQKKLRYKCIKAIKKINKNLKKNNVDNSYEFNLYSNFPIQFKYKGKLVLSKKITFEQMILQEALTPECIVVIDEFGSWIDQFSYKVKNIEKLDEHIRYWRHYHGNSSHLIVADQCSNNVVLQLRRRFNKVINCIETKFYLFGLFHITKYRVINISDEIKTIEELKADVKNKDENETDLKFKRYIGFHIPKPFRKLFKCYKEYDDRAYSNRYNKTFLNDLVEISILKTDEILKWDNSIYEDKIEKGIKEYDKQTSV